MAMNIATLKTALRNRIDAELTAGLAALYAGPADDHQLAGYTFGDYLDLFSEAMAVAIANEVVGHITGNAKCSGTDVPSADTHNNVGIV